MAKVKEPGVKQRATRRGVRSLDGKFYHNIKDRNAADKAFNIAKARNEALATVRLPTGIEKGHITQQDKAPFDFTFNEGIVKPDTKIITPSSANYHCNNCQTPVEFKAPVCPNCGGKLNWEGFE
jgi:Zn finger protein HypA/HybF involved in hydrogenase expression